MEASKSIDYSIIIPAFNEEDYLPATLAQIQRSMTFVDNTGEIIVVDNNSDDSTTEVARKYGAKIVTEPIQNIARARNKGAKASSGKILIFIDADTIINDVSIKETLALLNNEHVIGGGALLQRASFHQILFCYLNNRASSKRKLYFGCYMYFTRQSFFKIDGFNEIYYAGEDMDIFKRLNNYAKKHNKNIASIKNKVVYSDRKSKSYGLIRSAFLFYKLYRNQDLWKSKDACHKFWYERKPKKNKWHKLT